MLQANKASDYFANTKVPKDRMCVFIFLAADYGNLGDVAITFAQAKFIERHLPDAEVIEIPISKSLEGLWFVKRVIKKGDIVTTVGGGNLGDMYDQIEYIRQLVVKFFPNNKIISFPQTIDFADNAEGKTALRKAKKVYNNHNNIYFVAREEVSYKLMKESFPKAKVLLTPDIVLSYNATKNNSKRNGVVFCLRDDKEKKLTDTQNKTLRGLAKNLFEDAKDYDTHIGRDGLSLEERNKELNKIWDTFKRAELVITDRLHGMIFCYITNTPCLVFLNNNHKVNGTHKWINHARHIKLMNEFNETLVISAIEGLKNIDTTYKSIESNYQPLIDCLQND